MTPDLKDILALARARTVTTRKPHGLFTRWETKPDQLCIDMADMLEAATDQMERRDKYFELRRAADMRGIKLWQEANPGNDLVHPDHGDLVCWLTERLVWSAKDDGPLPEDYEINSYLPHSSGSYHAYSEALRLVATRKSKGGLVDLVNWLLVRIERLKKKIDDADKYESENIAEERQWRLEANDQSFRLEVAMRAMLQRDDENGSLPPTYRSIIEAALEISSEAKKPSDGDEETCLACQEPFKPDDMVLPDESGDYIHTACCGPEREGYTINGEPLGPDDEIPKGFRWGDREMPRIGPDVSAHITSEPEA